MNPIFAKYYQTLFLVTLCLFCADRAAAQNAVRFLAPAHALALTGSPKYAPDFKQFDYTCADALKGGILRHSATGFFDNFNPFAWKGIPDADWELLHDPLCVRSLDEPYTVYGLIAQKIELAADRSSIIFHLHPQATFQDGHPITAEDVVFSYQAVTSSISAGLNQFFKHIIRVKALDPSRVQFCFSQDAPRELPLFVASLKVYPKHWWQNRDLSKASLEIPLGSGPYRIQSFQAGRSVTYARVRNYWAQDLPVCRWQYNFDEIHCEYFRDNTVAREAFKAGLYDLRIEYDPRKWKAFDQLKDVVCRQIPYHLPQGIEGFFFNLRNPLFQNQKVRRALLLAFDWQWVNMSYLGGQYRRCNSFFSNSDLSAARFTQKTYPLPVSDGSGFNRKNLQKAARLLQEAGWQLKGGKLLSHDNTPFSFTVLTQSQQKKRLAQPWIQSLRKLGIEARVHLADSAEFFMSMRGYKYDVIAWGYGQRFWPGKEILLNWHSDFVNPDSGGRNLTGLAEKKIDRLCEKLVAVQDYATLKKLGQKLDAALMAGDYVVPLGVVSSYCLALRDHIAMPATLSCYTPGQSTWWDKNASSP